jgi:hypothetical protein
MTAFITSLSTTIFIYAFVTRGALVVARVLSALARKFSDNSPKKPPRGGHGFRLAEARK